MNGVFALLAAFAAFGMSSLARAEAACKADGGSPQAAQAAARSALRSMKDAARLDETGLRSSTDAETATLGECLGSEYAQADGEHLAVINGTTIQYPIHPSAGAPPISYITVQYLSTGNKWIPIQLGTSPTSENRYEVVVTWKKRLGSDKGGTEFAFPPNLDAVGEAHMIVKRGKNTFVRLGQTSERLGFKGNEDIAIATFVDRLIEKAPERVRVATWRTFSTNKAFKGKLDQFVVKSLKEPAIVKQ